MRKYITYKDLNKLNHIYVSSDVANTVVLSKLSKVPYYMWEFGEYSYGVTLNNRYIKFCRFINFTDKLRPYVASALTNEITLSDNDVASKYKRIRDENYTLLKKYLGKFLIDRYSTEIGLAPIRLAVINKFKKEQGQDPDDKSTNKIPLVEKNVIETYEPFVTYDNLTGFTYEKVSSLLESREMRKKLKMFSSSIKELLNNKGVLLDLYDKYPVFIVAEKTRVLPSSDTEFFELLKNSQNVPL
ncbi:hypothetical protein OAL67_01120, partial [bacterium]|nr:hypothetical protein [bacterium]